MHVVHSLTVVSQKEVYITYFLLAVRACGARESWSGHRSTSGGPHNIWSCTWEPLCWIQVQKICEQSEEVIP